MMSMDPMEMFKAMLPMHTRIPEQEVMVFTAPLKGHEGEWLIIAVKLPEAEEDGREGEEG